MKTASRASANIFDTVVNQYNLSSREYAKIDKGFLRITGQGNQFDPVLVEKARRCRMTTSAILRTANFIAAAMFWRYWRLVPTCRANTLRQSMPLRRRNAASHAEAIIILERASGG